MSVSATPCATRAIGTAIAAFREAVRLDPKLIAVRNNLITTLVDNGEPTAAVAAARDGVLVAPQDASSHAHLGFALDRQGKPEEPIPEFRDRCG